jgi:hypothetical protein
MRTVTATVLGCLLWSAPALAFMDLAGEVTAEQPCQAFGSFRKLTNPDAAKLAPGTTYRVLGRNQAGGEWLQVLLPGVEPQQRWVSVGCGRLSVAAAPAPTSGLEPFFDDIAVAGLDPAPPAPPMDALDRGVLEVCGAWGGHPRARDFRAMLDRPDVAPDMQQIYGDLGRGVRRDPVALSRFKDELTAVWFDAGGFTHVFCGEPGAGELGGLHYRGRYLQLQEQGLAGLMTATECRATEVDEPVYTVGLRYRLPGSESFRSACPKGYPYDLGARELLTAATLAYRQLRRSRGQEMCLAAIRATGGSDYDAVVVIRGDAIRTFYPDVTPSCDGGARPASCSCGG